MKFIFIDFYEFFSQILFVLIVIFLGLWLNAVLFQVENDNIKSQRQYCVFKLRWGQIQ